MPTHLTARLAWHDDDWNGRICAKPECNSFCAGQKSFPGDKIARERDLAREMKNAGKAIAALKGQDLPPCIYSANAFGPEMIRGYSNPPDFFFGGAKRTEWDIPPATVCVWPYEAMYEEGVYTEGGRLNNDQRRENAKSFFEALEPGRSLIFYYANYSNPFSEEENSRYTLIGVSRVKEVGDELVYEDVSQYVKERYAGGMIWGRNVGSYYPDQGLRLPYHRYRNSPEALARFALFPENPRTCKYGARHLTDDDAIGLLEQFLHSVYSLRDLKDDSEDWAARERWLLSCISELWSKRGLYPGLLSVIEYLKAEPSILPARDMVEAGQSKEAYQLFFHALDKGKEAPALGLMGKVLAKLSREWRLLEDDAQAVLRTVLPRLDLDVDQIANILDERNREAHGLPQELSGLVDNPYLLAERYVGDTPGDTIPWSTVDRGVLPSPELGGETLAEMELNDARRLRALCVEHLRREPNQTFRSADGVLGEVNARLDKLPEWKRATFTAKYFKVDKQVLEEALVLRSEGNQLWLYLREVFEDERAVEATLTSLAGRPDIALRKPFTDKDWRNEITDQQSPLLHKAREEYTVAVETQVKACAAIFPRPVAVVTGRAGTGKTTVICAVIRAVRRTEGEGAPVMVLAPTGKASDRVRAIFHQRGILGVTTATVHSLLAKGGWLNENLTLRRSGGKVAGGGTIIVDEASMLDLGLMAGLIRAIDWPQVRRLVLVGDPSQLPPIGRGRVFADTIQWLLHKDPKGVARLMENLRQMENRVAGRGTGILRLAELFLVDAGAESGTATSPEGEEFLARVHEGGDVDKDLRVLFWDDPTQLAGTLIDAIEAEMMAKTHKALNPEKPYELWREAFERCPERYQVLTPHRGDLHGVEALNEVIQERISGGMMNWVGAVDGITLFDKVIQVRNRPQSNRIWAYNYEAKQPELVEIFNGELGFVEPHNYDRDQIKAKFRGSPQRFRLKRFQVKFARKEHLAVGYGKELPKGGKGFTSEKVEENLELAYAISIHKAQGSEFEQTYVVVPTAKGRPLSPELIYTALTRASGHCTLMVQGDVSTMLTARRPENAQTRLINSSLFDGYFRAVPDQLIHRHGWYEEGKIHEALTGDMVRSKSELVIANLLHERGIPFQYEILLRAPDGTMFLPDFTVIWNGETWFWEHWGMTQSDAYQRHREVKVAWYEKHFPGRLLETFEGKALSRDAAAIIEAKFSS